ncbi:probable BOI-related E3 ubiquitin-protein ligase 3 [Salvia miltiorrhiza]|nr:probable BOI-related E3 ubiquitin-protein ligase 3 isoform X2 [Salvia miltiorrhiza]XP_057774552.1 probable BOI-related E3 ubiquitin-protein ligase 3 [Salvia miltiorrhiza]XP_057774553.1 probable BOI-related E3 ubiquitin-protein ligase 3 [Salvia miltiorrhiza]
MFRGNNGNTAAPSFLENHLQYPEDVSNQLQFCGNLPVEFHADPVNYLGSNNGPPYLLPNKCGRDAEAIPRQQKLLFSLNNNTSNDESERKASTLNLNPVSTGLRLSYDDEERNSSITSASGSLTAASSVFPYLSNDIKRELDQQKEELNHFIRTQEANMVKGVRDMRHRHMASFVTAIEKGVSRKLREKDAELETITRRNKELVESMKQVTSEAQNWCYMAKYNESIVNVLKTNLEQAMQGSNAGKEGCGESDVDDAASCIDPNNYLSVSASVKKDIICKACKAKEVSILLMPCRHFCLCKECQAFATVCPVCQMITTASFEVYLS